MGSIIRDLIAKFRFKLKKVGKTPRSFRYDLSQIPYNYRVEVTNRVKGLALIDRVPEELWTEVHDIVQEAGIKTIPKKKKCKKAKWLSEEALQIPHPGGPGPGELALHCARPSHTTVLVFRGCPAWMGSPVEPSAVQCVAWLRPPTLRPRAVVFIKL